MDHEIVRKVQRIVASSAVDEAQVVHLLALVRKLIEQAPARQVRNYPVLKFYCDWALHSKIDRSEAGAEMLAKLHEIVAADLDRPGDLGAFINKLTNALALPQVRLDINKLVHQFHGPAEVVGATRWRQLVPVIAEIVSNIPLTNNAGNTRLKAIAQGMQAAPLRGTSSVIESLVIIPNAQLDRQSQDPQVPYWLELKTPMNNGTARFLAPLRVN